MEDLDFLCQIIYKIDVSGETDQVLEMYSFLRDYFLKPGELVTRENGSTVANLVIPPLICVVIKLVPRIISRESGQEVVPLQDDDKNVPQLAPIVFNLKRTFQTLHGLCFSFHSKTANFEGALVLWLNCAVEANRVDCQNPSSFEAICFEFLTQGMILFEEEFADSNLQYKGICLLAGTLMQISCLTEENYKTMAGKIAVHSSKLLRKPDQVQSLCMVSHLYWHKDVHTDGSRVLEILRKSLKIADSAVQTSPANAALFLDILDKYLYFFEDGIVDITVAAVNNLIAVCSEHLTYLDSGNCPNLEEIQTHYNNTTANARMQKQTNSRFSQVVIP